MTDHYEERAAMMHIHGDLPRDEAERLARDSLTQDTGGEMWAKVSKRWHAVCGDVHGRDQVDDMHDRLKAKLGADAWGELTIAQLEGSIGKMRRYQRKHH